MPRKSKELTCPVYLQAQENPDRIVLRDSESILTYGQLELQIERAVEWLAGLGVNPQDRVAIIAENSIDLAVLIFALYRAGVTAMPLNLRRGTDWWRRCIRASGCRLAIVDPQCREVVGKPRVPVVLLEGGEWRRELGVGRKQGSSRRPPKFPIDSETTILFTSGIMGEPKGVILTFGNHYFNAIGSNENLQLGAGDSWLAVLPFYHVGGLAILFRTAIAGASAHIMGRFEPATINPLIDTGKVTHLSLVPTMLLSLIEERGMRPVPKTLKAILLGGAPARESLFRSIEALHLPVLTTYGMTETASQVTTLSPTDSPERLRSAGRPLRHAEVRIIDSRGRPIERGKVGEIAVRGEIVFRGYIGEAREETFEPDGWFRTGDLGVLDPEGYLHVKGRLDDLIISGGENICLGEIERAAEDFPGVIECAAIGIEDETWGQRPVLFVQARVEDFAGERALRESLDARLPKIAIPDRIIVLEKVPRESIGKIDRERLKTLYWERFAK